MDFLKATGNLTLQQTTFREGVHEGKAVPLVPRFMANLGLDVALPYGFSLRPALRHTGKQYLGSDFDNSAEQLEGYTLYDLFLHWRKHLNGTQLSAFAGVENVSNVKYSSMRLHPGAVPYTTRHRVLSCVRESPLNSCRSICSMS